MSMRDAVSHCTLSRHSVGVVIEQQSASAAGRALRTPLRGSAAHCRFPHTARHIVLHEILDCIATSSVPRMDEGSEAARCAAWCPLGRPPGRRALKAYLPLTAVLACKANVICCAALDTSGCPHTQQASRSFWPGGLEGAPGHHPHAVIELKATAAPPAATWPT